MAAVAPATASTLAHLIKPQPSTNYPPNPTLYLSNIDWSIKKPLLKRALYTLFTRHGKVLDVIVLRGSSASSGKPLRGQAWVIYESVTAATAALVAEQNFVFFGRPLAIAYAKETSDRIAKRDGSYKKKSNRRANDKETEGKNAETASAKTTSTAPTTTSSGPQPSSTPTSTLITSKIPSECNEMMLSMLFKQHSGYKSVTPCGDSKGVYTVQFNSESEAAAAMKGLHGFRLNNSCSLELCYGQE